MVIKEQKHRHVSEDEFIRAEQKRSKETQKHEHLCLYFNLITHLLPLPQQTRRQTNRKTTSNARQQFKSNSNQQAPNLDDSRHQF